jgi:hypothetical protein
MSSRRPFVLRTVCRLLKDLIVLVRLGLTPRAHLAAENLVLRKQLALFQERRTKPRRSDPATRIARLVIPVAGLALAAHGGPTRHIDPMAPSGMAIVLAVEVEAPGSAEASRRPAATDRHHGPREPDLGRRAHRG